MPYHLATTPFLEVLSGRWDSNPRPSPWQGDVLPLYYARSLVSVSDRECRDPGSNWGHRDFQSRALPTELSRPDLYLLSVRDFTRGYRDCQARVTCRTAKSAGTQGAPPGADAGSLDLHLLPHYNARLHQQFVVARSEWNEQHGNLPWMGACSETRKDGTVLCLKTSPID